MGGSFRIGTIRGIPIRIHFTFLFVLPLLAFLFGSVFQTAAELADVPPEAIRGHPYVWGLGIAVMLFVGVLIHELAHALYAIRTGGKVIDITLLMIGGVSRISEPPNEVKHQAWMAAAGPLTSLALGAIAFGVYALLAGTQAFDLQFAVFYIGYLNVLIGVFNLLPAFPMDGGRILRALLVRRKGPVGATQTAAAVGKGFALLFGLLGILSFNIFLLLIAFFVYIGAEGESRQVLMEAVLGRLKIDSLMEERTTSVESNVPVYDAGERMVQERRLGFPVTEGGMVRGVVTLAQVQMVPPERRQDVTAGEVARPVKAFRTKDEVWSALREMEEQQVHQVPVVDSTGRLIGTLTRDAILRGLQLRELDSSLHGDRPWAYRRREV